MGDNDIKVLKDNLAKDMLSFIIGSGFSKNLYKDFPTWANLLEGIVYKLHGPEIKQSYHSYAQGKVCYKRFRQQKIAEIISREGYLKIASDYIKKCGYHEGIDIYIEKNIPYLVRTEKGFDLYRDKHCIATDETLDKRVHNALFSLKVKDIFTFNYDNLLEIFANADNDSELGKKEDEIRIRRNEFEYLVSQYHEINNADEKYIETVSSDCSDQTDSHSNEDNRLQFCKAKLQSYVADIPCDKIEQAINDKRNDFESQLNKIANERNNCYHKVNNSWDISISLGRRNIYKLHGDLRIESSQPYGFDYDLEHQYIISQEDYNTYADRHEAFVNLMKISLLQGVMCIVGFSCDDPNFLAWMSWVKSVLQKKEAHDSVNKHVFFIDAQETKLSPDKEQLFKNNHIQYISLENLYHAGNATENLLCFFDDLKSDFSDYDDLLFRTYKTSDKYAISKLWKNRTRFYLPALNNFANNEYRRQVLCRYRKANKYTQTEWQAFVIALTGERLFVQNIIEYDIDKDEITDQSTCEALELLELRGQIVENKPVKIAPTRGDAFYFELVLQMLFAFEYDKAFDLLQQWHTNGLWQTRRLSLISMYNQPDRQEVDRALFGNVGDISIQEYIYTLNILPLIRGEYTQKNGGVTPYGDVGDIIKDLLKRYPELHELHDDIELFEKVLLQDDLDPTKAYDSNQWTISLGKTDQKWLRATQLLHTFIDLGLPMHNHTHSFINVKVWYAAFRRLFEDFPYPSLYYSLQYGTDKQLMRRIAQDYAYSPKIYPYLPDMLTKLLKAYQCERIPQNVSVGVLVICDFWLQCVDNNIWENPFRDIVKRCDFLSTDINRSTLDPIYHFIETGLKHSKDYELKQKVCLTCLGKLANIDGVDNLLVIAACQHLVTITSDIRSHIDKLLDTDLNATHIFVLENLKRFMNRCQKNKLRDKITSYDYTTTHNIVMFELASRYISRENSDFSSRLKSAIIANPRLWDTGINGKAITGGKYIRLSRMQNSIRWEEEEISTLYKKMIASIRNIESQKGGDFFYDILDQNWRLLLLEMIAFLSAHKKILYKQSDYDQIRETVLRLYRAKSGYKTAVEALTSADSTIVSHVIEEMVYDIQMGKISKNRSEYTIIANRILMRKPEGLKSCFVHYAWCLEKYRKKFPKAMFGPITWQIMEEYRKYFDKDNAIAWDINAPKDIIESSLLQLYKTCKKWGYNEYFWNEYIPQYNF